MTVTAVMVGASDHAINEKLRAALAAGIEIVGIADLDPERLTRALAFTEERAGYRPVGLGSADEAFALDADCAILVTPTPTHARLAKAALRSGKHVHVEKPAATNEAQLLDMIATAEALRLGISVGFQKRIAVQAALKAVRDGLIGELLGGKATWTRKWLDLDEPYWIDAATGGVTLDFVHMVDLIVRFADARPLSACMVGRNDRGQAQVGERFKAEAKAMGMVIFEGLGGPLPITLDLDWASHQTVEFAGILLDGTVGQLRLWLPTTHETTHGLRAIIKREGHEDVRLDPPLTNDECHVRVMEDLVASIVDPRRFDTRGDLLRTQSVLDALRDSAREKGHQQLIVSS